MSGSAGNELQFCWLYCTVLYYIYSSVLYCTILYCTIFTILYFTLRHSTILYFTVLYYTLLYHIISYCIIMNFDFKGCNSCKILKQKWFYFIGTSVLYWDFTLLQIRDSPNLSYNVVGNETRQGRNVGSKPSLKEPHNQAKSTTLHPNIFYSIIQYLTIDYLYLGCKRKGGIRFC